MLRKNGITAGLVSVAFGLGLYVGAGIRVGGAMPRRDRSASAEQGQEAASAHASV